MRDSCPAREEARCINLCEPCAAKRAVGVDDDAPSTKAPFIYVLVVLGGAVVACDRVSLLVSSCSLSPLAPATVRWGGSGLLACRVQSCRHVSGFGSDSRGGLPALVQPVVDAIVLSLWSRATGGSQVACASHPNSDGAMPCRRRCLWPAFVVLCWADEGWHPNWNGIRSPSAQASLVTVSRPYGASARPEGLWMR